MNRRLIFIAPLVAFLFLVFLLSTGLGKDPTRLDSKLVGKSIPQFSLPSLLRPEQQITPNDIKGPALLNVFASWCPACYSEHEFLLNLSRQNQATIYGLNYKDVREKGIGFIEHQGNPYRLIISDLKGRLGIDMGVYGAPETFVINVNNQIVYRHVGVVDQNAWDSILKDKLYPPSNVETGQ